MAKRLTNWVKNFNLLPEYQSGFRRKRSCVDNIFTLNALIQNRLSLEKGKVFALFIDLKSAFPSVNHNLLWNKLFRLGTDTKFSNILIDLYNKANMSVKGTKGTSNPIDVTNGVLQGEVLSPILFSLFIRDIEEFMLEEGIRGVSINHLIEVLLLAYADDIVVFADSQVQMRKILNCLYRYCELNYLEINIKKTKIVIFGKCGHGYNNKQKPFMYGNEKTEIVSIYTY